MRAQRVHDLVADFHRVILRHYKEEGEPDRDRVLEVLAAFANAAAAVLAGTGKSREAQEYFYDCLEQSTEQLIADQRKKDGRVN